MSGDFNVITQENRSSVRDCEECNVNALWDMLRRIEKKLDIHIAEQTITQPQFEELLKTFEQSKGAIKFMRGIVYIVAPAVAAIAWAKDHIKL